MPQVQLSNAEFAELRFVRDPVGPSSKSICRVRERSGCGSGCLVGKPGGKSLVLTNAHVAGTTPGKTVQCDFPFANMQGVRAKIIMAAYSDRIMMDWAVLEIDSEIPLPAVKLRNDAPSGRHYTAGYPRCQGPYFQEVETVRVIHNGTVWQWTPNSIGGQSGSAIHSVADDLQVGLLTWSWAGYGAGQTTRSIWLQYANRAAVGFLRPEGLIELADPENRAQDVEEGFHAQTNITTLPIWSHIDDEDDGDGDDGNQHPADPRFAAEVERQAIELRNRADNLLELARKHKGAGGSSGASEDDSDDSNNSGPVFGL